MHIITRKTLLAFGETHQDAVSALDRWYRLIKHARIEDFDALRELFPSADLVGNQTVFNIGGNKYRLIAIVYYNRQTVFVRHVLTHKEYDKGNWKE